jgi:signal transduction histidine kinase
LRGFSMAGYAPIEGRARAIDCAAPFLLLSIFPTVESARAEDALRGVEASPPSLLGMSAMGPSFTVIAMALALILAVVTVVINLAARRRWSRRTADLDAELARARAKLDRMALIMQGDRQIVVSWDRPEDEPALEGDFALIADPPSVPRVLDYGSWLEDAAAAQVREASDRLLNRGESFSIAAVSRHGRHVEIVGRPVSGNAVMRIRDVSADRLEVAETRDRLAQAEEASGALRSAMEAAAVLAWRRDAEGRMVWCNGSYAGAVEAPDNKAAVDEGIELLDPTLRREAAEAIRETGVWNRRASAVVKGERRAFDAVEVRTARGSTGIAHDVTEITALRAEMERNEDDYSRMIDRLSTAVAIFDKSKRLTFYNAAYRQMWSLEPAFLDQGPSDGEILDRLRSKRQLPEQANFREWKAQLMSAYQAIEPSETVWHLPDGRALRVVTSPNPKGGVTYLYDDATQSFALASQVNALTHVQGETLDSLKEGVAVFGADGRMKLFNPVFAEMWRVDQDKLRARPHVDELADGCRALCQDAALWDGLRDMIVGLNEHRESRSARIARNDGLTLDCAALPLPDGATLLTSLDVTASANVERALTERNLALVAAEKLRNDFVNHVSYELRTPLTNIIGFTQLLAAGGVGPLNSKQLEYAGFITNSSHALLAIIDDILDLASIDAGALELRLEAVDVAEAMKAAAAGVQDRLDEAAIEMRMVMTDGVGAFKADGRRVRQVLFNLLSNAINYSEPGQTVTLAAMRRGAEIVFKVSDRGRGIPPDMIDRVFNRFETLPNGSRHRGPGLGLSIVKAMVELHKGRVLIDTAPNEGTTVTCIFPIDPSALESGAEEPRRAAQPKPQSAR